MIATLMQLPGVGRNTAHAVAAFAYGLPVPVMEANVKRVLSRIFALKTPGEALLWKKAEALLDRRHPFDYNQAMMDLGATVCTRRAPSCGVCPARALCRGKESPQHYPASKKKRAVPVVRKNILLLTDGKRYVVVRRKGKFLGGLYGFPEIEAGQKSFAVEKDIHRLILTRYIKSIRQVYSHFVLEAKIYKYTLSRRQISRVAQQFHGVYKTSSQIAMLPISKSDKKILDIINN